MRSCAPPTPTGMRITGFLTNTAPAGPAASSPTWSCVIAATPASRTASAPARTPGCATCPSTTLNQNRVWLAIAALAADLLAWTARLALPATGRDLRAQAAAAAHPGRGRTNRAHRATARPAHRPRLALGRRDHHRAPARLCALARALTINSRPDDPGPGAPADRRWAGDCHCPPRPTPQQDQIQRTKITVRPYERSRLTALGVCPETGLCRGHHVMFRDIGIAPKPHRVHLSACGARWAAQGLVVAGEVELIRCEPSRNV